MANEVGIEQEHYYITMTNETDYDDDDDDGQLIDVEAELLSELEVHQLACKRNFCDYKSWMKWGLALQTLAYRYFTETSIMMHYLRGAKCKLEKALLIKEDYYEAMYELGMVHYGMLRWDRSLEMYGDTFMEHCHIATDLFKEVKDKAPDVYLEDMLERVSLQMPSKPKAPDVYLEDMLERGSQQMPSKLKGPKVWVLPTEECRNDDDDKIDDGVGASSSFKRKMIEDALNLVVEKFALDPDDFVSKIKVVDALHRLPINYPNGGGKLHEKNQRNAQEV